jgi:hypothetical protein
MSFDVINAIYSEESAKFVCGNPSKIGSCIIVLMDFTYPYTI